MMSHLPGAYNDFSSSCSSFSSLLSQMKISLKNMTMKVLGTGSSPVHALFRFFSENSVGRVSSSKYIGSVSSSESVGCVRISKSVGLVSEIFSVGSVC